MKSILIASPKPTTEDREVAEMRARRRRRQLRRA